MNELRTAIISNNNGAHFLSRNDTSQAMQSFQNAIQSIKQARDIFAEQPNEETSRFFSNICQIHFGTRMEGLQEGLFYIFDRAVILCPRLCQLNNCEEINSYIFLVSVVVLFNLALSTHIHALQCDSSHLLRRAIQVYSSAAAILSEINLNGPFSMLSWLIVNNLASLHYVSCDYGKCALYFKYLQGKLHDRKEVELFESMIFEEEELQGLMLNFFFPPTPVAAHAA